MPKVNFRYFITNCFERIMEGEGTNEGGNAEGGTGTNEGAGTGAGTGTGDGSQKTFTQQELENVVAQERKKFEATTRKTIQELENLKRQSGTSEAAKTSLEQRITELNETLMTKEELARKEKERLTNEYQHKLKTTEDERLLWENRYKTSTAQREILDAAVRNQAFDPEQIEAFLSPKARVVEVTDDAGNPTGSFTTKVKINTTGKDGKPVTLDVSVEEAVKSMRETPDRFGNLFKDLSSGGTGGTGGNSPKGPIDVSKLSPEQYRAQRKQILSRS